MAISLKKFTRNENENSVNHFKFWQTKTHWTRDCLFSDFRKIIEKNDLNIKATELPTRTLRSKLLHSQTFMIPKSLRLRKDLESLSDIQLVEGEKLVREKQSHLIINHKFWRNSEVDFWFWILLVYTLLLFRNFSAQKIRPRSIKIFQVFSKIRIKKACSKEKAGSFMLDRDLS